MSEETFYAIRRTDGSDIGEGYGWMAADGPDDWTVAEEESACWDEPAEYEIVLMHVESIARKTFPEAVE